MFSDFENAPYEPIVVQLHYSPAVDLKLNYECCVDKVVFDLLLVTRCLSRCLLANVAVHLSQRVLANGVIIFSATVVFER